MTTYIDEITKRLLSLLQYHPEEPLLFTSGMFLFFMLFFVLGYFLLRKRMSVRLVYVTLCSYYFFYKNSGSCFLLLALVTLTDFYLAKAIARHRYSSPKRSQYLLVASLVIDLGLLVVFKYTPIFAATIVQTLRGNFQPGDILPVVGISFFVFKSISYVVDVWRGTTVPFSRITDYAFHVSFFPALLAGPIVRAADFAPQIRRPLSITPAMLSMGTWLIITGLLKKAVVSDYISVNLVNRVFDMPSMHSGVEVLLALYGYSVQIYCDFSGYSDMAIGLSLLMGFRLPANFNAPYKADSLADFWRRWHISLSSWIKDYVYIPLGGSRKGTLRMYLNQLVSMTLCGLWHGASLTFVLWGLLHGVGVCLHKLFSQTILHHDRHYHPLGWRRVVAVVVTFHLVTLLWLPFRSSDLHSTWLMLTRMLTRFNVSVVPDVVWAYRYVVVLIGLALLAHVLPSSWQQRCARALQQTGVVGCAVALTVAIWLVVQVKGSAVLPFIYFQF